MLKVEVPATIPLLVVEKTTLLPLFTRYPVGIPAVVPIANVDDPGGLEIVYENGSYT
jgi:hypothetical protein